MKKLTAVFLALLMMISCVGLGLAEGVSSPAIGQTIRFETVDLDGNRVISEELFSKNRVTMINIWCTWCGACKSEMKDLAEIHERLQKKGCGILGLSFEMDQTPETSALIRQILAENGDTYPNVYLPADRGNMEDMIGGYPTSIFVDSTGKVVAAPILGNKVDLYETTVDQVLAGEPSGQQSQTADPSAVFAATGASAASAVSDASVTSGIPAAPASDDAPAPSDNAAAPVVTANTEKAYRVYVLDGTTPVSGVMISFCGTTCTAGFTDENGMARFEMPEGEYTIHLLKVPDGFASDPTEYRTLTTFSDVSIFLKKN